MNVLENDSLMLSIKGRQEYSIERLFMAYKPKYAREINCPADTIFTVDYTTHQEGWQGFDLPPKTIKSFLDNWEDIPFTVEDEKYHFKEHLGSKVRLSYIDLERKPGDFNDYSRNGT